MKIFACCAGGLLVMVSAAGAAPLCRMDPAVRAQLDVAAPPNEDANASQKAKDARVAAVRAFAKQHTDDLLVEEALLDARLGAADSEPARVAIVAEREAQAKAAPLDAHSRFLLAAAQSALDRKEATATYADALKLDPSLVLVQLRLAYANQAKHRADALVQARAFTAACPMVLEGQALVVELSPPAQRRPLLAALRSKLEAATDPRDLSEYQSLWRSMFADAPRREQPALRKQVAADVTRLRALPNLTPTLLSVAGQGADLVGDKAAKAALEELSLTKFPGSWASVVAAHRRFTIAEPRPEATAPLEKIRAYERARYAASATWVEKWPALPTAWAIRLAAVAQLPDVPAAEVLAIADRTLAITRDSADDARGDVASLFLDRGVRVEQASKLLEGLYAEVERDAASFGGETERDHVMSDGNLAERWSLQVELVRAKAMLHDMPACERAVHALEALAGAKRYEDEDEDKQERKEDLAYARARLHAAQGHLPDAVAEGLDVLRQTKGTLRRDAFTTELARWWKTLGGSPAALALLTAKPAADNMENVFKAPKHQLPGFTLTDLDGRTWSLDKLKGKVVLVNVWATWCPPCKQELPHVQALFDQLRGRRDVVLLSISADDNAGLVDPFVQEHKVTFPVLLGKSYLDEKVDLSGIPITWIFDTHGKVAREVSGYDPSAPFEAQALAAIDEVRRGVPGR